MSLLTTLRAVVCGDIDCAEPAICARQADQLALAPFRFQQHVLVEHFFWEYLVASFAVQSLSVSLAVNAGICFPSKGPYIFDLAARCATVARCAA